MACKVTRSHGVMVQPSEPTPSGTLDLSVIDKLTKFIKYVSLFCVFRHGHEPAKVIREALSRALVPYYPLAGRLKESSDGDLQVACTTQGVWFVEASANYSLDSVHYFDDALMSSSHDLIPTSPSEDYSADPPLLQLQITRFTCDGFVLALKHSHTICDSLGAAQFLNAVGELARGFLHPAVAPVWKREAIPTPPWLLNALGGQKVRPPPSPAPAPGYELQQAYLDIPLQQINNLKKEFLDFTGKNCSTFDIVAAYIWQKRTRAINFEKRTDVHLVFVMNMRPFFDPPLPDGFYGNCLYPMPITRTSGWVVEASNAEIVKVIRDAKARVPGEFRKWLKSEKMDGDTVDPFSSPVGAEYCTLSISGWGNLGFEKLDCGWGTPVNVLPVDGFNVWPMVIVGSLPAPKKGIRLTTWCVTTHHLPSLVDCYASGTLSRL